VARRAYVEGTRAVDEERWADAVAAFREAYSHGQNPAALFNVGVALRALGRYVEAREAFTSLLGDHGSIGDDLAARARTMLQEADARIATLVVEGPVGCELVLDGRETGTTADAAREIAVDAGEHHLRASCEGLEEFVWSREVEAGERVSVVIVAAEARPAPDDTAMTAAPADVSAHGPGAAPWVVLAIGAAVAVAGGVLFGVAIADTSTVENVPVGTPFAEVQSAYDRAQLLGWLGPVALGVGGAAAIAGLVWALAGGSKGSAAVEVDAGLLGVQVRGSL
jgi:hypothetical protein